MSSCFKVDFSVVRVVAADILVCPLKSSSRSTSASHLQDDPTETSQNMVGV